MQSILTHIQEDICKYAEAIKGVTSTDVEIVDEHMIRVAGTGIYRHMLNLSVANEGYIYQHSIQSKKTILVENPRENILCFSCEKRAICQEKLDLTTPIFYKERVIGVISIICLTDEQKDNLLRQFDKFINFIEKIAELISGKAFEYIEKLSAQNTIDAYHAVIEHIDKGVVAINHLNQIWQANLSAKRLLELPDNITDQTLFIERIGHTPYGDEEGYMSFNNNTTHVSFNAISLPAADGNRLTMLVFQKMTDDIEINEVQQQPLQTLIGSSNKMTELKKMIAKIAISHSNVLITGETGTGKEVVATAIHQQSPGHQAPFVTINCAAIPDQLLESELFGYVRGAFSGADPKGRVGKFELAHNGTLFLDEIGDMPIHLQAKLLRVLQEGTISRIGSNSEIKVNVRVIAATNKDLLHLIAEKQFREDLYYRLNVVPLHLAPLRERKADIVDLVDYFIKNHMPAHRQSLTTATPETLNLLYQYDWPGNIRELRNVIEYMYVMLGSGLKFNKTHLPSHILHITNRQSLFIHTLKKTNQDEKESIQQTLEQNGWHVQGKIESAKVLNISLATLYRKLKRYDLNQ